MHFSSSNIHIRPDKLFEPDSPNKDGNFFSENFNSSEVSISGFQDEVLGLPSTLSNTPDRSAKSPKKNSAIKIFV